MTKEQNTMRAPPCDHDAYTPCPPECREAKEQWRRDVARELSAMQREPLTSKQRLTPEKLAEYRCLRVSQFVGVGGDGLQLLLDEIEACWAERSTVETAAPNPDERDAARYRFIRERMTKANPITYYSMPHALMFLRDVRGAIAFDREVDARINGAAFESSEETPAHDRRVDGWCHACSSYTCSVQNGNG